MVLFTAKSTRSLFPEVECPEIVTLSSRGLFDASKVVCVSKIEQGSFQVARTIIVPDEFQTIQLAVDSANPGDTILVRNGMYFENVSIKKTLTLIGENADTTIIDGKNVASPIYIRANNVVIGNFTVQNCKPAYPDSGIGIYGKNNTIANNIIKGNNIGIYLYYSQNNTLIHNQISNSLYGIWTDHVSSNNTIKNNMIFSSRLAGIHAGLDSGNNTITANTFSSNNYGIFMSTNGNSIFHNNFVNNTYHAWIGTENNKWDNGQEGNYWDDYQSENVTREGIGNQPYFIAELGQDNNPLLGMFSEYTVGFGQVVTVISNSTVERLEYYESNETISIHISGEATTRGFCRVGIPKMLVSINNLSIIIDNGLTSVLYFNPLVFEDQAYRGIYVEYEQGSHEISIVTENISWIFVCVLMLAVLMLAALEHK